MDAIDALFTTDAFLSYSGATGMTLVVSNTYQTLSNKNPRIFAFIFAQLIVLIGIVFYKNMVIPEFIVGFANGCLIFLAVLGASTFGADFDERRMKPQSRSEQRHFWTRW